MPPVLPADVPRARHPRQPRLRAGAQGRHESCELRRHQCHPDAGPLQLRLLRALVYLDEEPILQNAPTYLPYFKDDLDYTLEHLDDLVIKDVAEAGGYGVVFGSSLPKEKQQALKDKIIEEPRRFISQQVIDFEDLPIMDSERVVGRKADLRAFVLSGEETYVWPCGLTRFSRNPSSFIVNSSQGGGFKDTWVLSH